jgi:hypothetical protein
VRRREVQMADLLPEVVSKTRIGTVYRGMLRYVRVARAFVSLLIATRRSTPTELWLGDSHSIFLNKEYASGVLTRAPEGQLVWHLGPRLMHSIARNGFPPKVERRVRLLRRFSRPGSIVPVVVTGEIDVRCHLVRHSSDPDFNFDFVADYVRNVRGLAERLGAPMVVVAVPPPPSVDCPRNPEFPIQGSIAERITVFGDLREALIKAVANTSGRPRVLLLDATDLLVDGTGEFRSDLTDDGCHTNTNGVRKVRSRAHELDLW